MAICNVCNQAEAFLKALILTSDPTVTLWVCDECTPVIARGEGTLVGEEKTIEDYWANEEANRADN